MVTNRGQGAGLLPYPNKIREMLDAFYQRFDIKISVKMRAGMNSAKEIESVIPVLNDFSLNEIIVHSRIAKQLYSGTISFEAFEFAAKNTHHKLVFNGDIFTVADYEKIKKTFPKVQHFMLGRGVLHNPFLPFEIKNIHFSETEKMQKLAEFQQCMLDYYIAWMDNEGNALNKMKQFWIYFSSNFYNEKKILKQIKKTKTLNDYKTEVNMIFKQMY
jgi:tRNA-dihydrouridine synthase